MKRILALVPLLLLALPLWADYGLSNVVTIEIEAPEAPRVEEVVKCAKSNFYPYTIHISSWQDREQALSELEKVKLEPVFITKIDLGERGIWYRVDYGVFETMAAASARLKEVKAAKQVDKGAFVGGAVPYSVEIETFESMEAATELLGRFDEPGFYIVPEGTCFRVLAGAYPTLVSANLVYSELAAKGLDVKIMKR